MSLFDFFAVSAGWCLLMLMLVSIRDRVVRIERMIRENEKRTRVLQALKLQHELSKKST